MKKKILSWLLLLTLLLSAMPVLGAELSVTETETLIKGVTYQHMKCLLDNGWQDIHIITADLNEPHLKFDVLSHANGKSYLENTYASAVNNDAVAAINADFFQSGGSSGRGNAIGLEISDGVLRTSPAAYEKMNVLYETKKDSRLLFDMFDYSFNVVAPDGAEAPITVINKYDAMTGIVLYTPDWGEKTPGSAGNVFELVVSDDTVVARNQDVGPVDIPKDGYVLACDLSMNTFIYDNLPLESDVTLSIMTKPSHELIETAVGGGGMLLVEGYVPDNYSHTISGTQPRSAVGVDKSGKILTLVAVDGRRTGATGMTMKQLGYLMAELGCYNAMNLDGGGSTLMAVKQDGSHKVVNTPSDGSKRSVTNSIGITANIKDKKVPASGRILADSNTLFAGTSKALEFDILDQYGVLLKKAEASEIVWTVSDGNGSVENNLYRASSAGTVTLRGETAGVSAELILTVLDTPKALTFSAKEYKVSPGETTLLWLSGRDSAGTEAPILLQDVTLNISDSSILSITGNRASAKAAGAVVVSATLGGATAYTAVTIGGASAPSLPKNVVLPDPMEKSGSKVTPGGFNFTVFGNTRTPVKFFDLYIMNGVVNALKKESNMNYFVGNGVDSSLLADLGNSRILASGYSSRTYNNSTFITLKNAYGASLFGSDKTQWEKLRQQVETLSGDNLFVFLNDHNISSMGIEITVFKNLMKEAAKKVSNVYVFAGGWVNETVIEDGVRYITTAGIFPSIGVKPPATNLSYLKYYLVTVNGDTVTYETKGILE